MNKTFRIDPFGSVTHSDKTREISAPIEGWGFSKFVRLAIVRYAEGLGYKPKSYKKPPAYLNSLQWEDYQRLSKRSKIVDYNYYLAFHWLKTLIQFSHIKDGELLRLIIENSEDVALEFASNV